jgi:transposase-like protein
MGKNKFFESVEVAEKVSLDELARLGAQEMLRAALKAEISVYMDSVSDCKLADGRQAIVLNGNHQQRKITVGSGTVAISVPRTRNRADGDENFISRILPPYMRRSPKIDEVVPLLYLRGLSTGDMLPALEKLLGKDASGLSAANVSRLKAAWNKDYEQWQKRDLSDKRYCYIWADGIYANVRFGDNRICILVVVGALENGKKELIAVASGYRESTESWRYLLSDLKQRGMACPVLGTGDGALGFWGALKEVFPSCRWQRCWVHKTANVLDKMPKQVQGRAKTMIHEIYMAESKEAAGKAFDVFLHTFEGKYPKATECLEKDREHLLTFYDFPSHHWKHIRTTNPIESPFATVRLRTKKTRGQGTETTTLLMIFKLLQQASLRWQCLAKSNLIPLVLAGQIFVDGEMEMAA